MSIYSPGRPYVYYPMTRTGSLPPQSPGEYRIRSHTGKILYIGETNNLCRRMHEHIRSGKISADTLHPERFEYQLADKRSTSHTRRDHERTKIRQHQPPNNNSSGGEGRKATR